MLHTVITILLALLFLFSGLGKASGSAKALDRGTRAIGVPDGLARFTGAMEALGALGLVVGFKFSGIAWAALIGLWITMAGAMFFHFKAKDTKGAMAPFVLLILITVAIVTIP